VEEQLSVAETADYSPPPVDASRGSTTAPKSAATPELNRYTVKKPAIATVTGNFRVTATDCDSDTHHIVLDFGSSPFPVLEGQSIGIIPLGTDAFGRPHHARQYSIASPRDGERPEYNNLALTVKRVTVDHAGNPVVGVASSYLCNLQKGDQVKVIGPFGGTFLMPDDPSAHLLMICTGTGSAPMRAMTERRRRRRGPNDGRLILFFGARSAHEAPLGFHRDPSRLFARGRAAEAIRAGHDAGQPGIDRADAVETGYLYLRLWPQRHGRWRARCTPAIRGKPWAELAFVMVPPQNRRPTPPGNLLSAEPRTNAGFALQWQLRDPCKPFMLKSMRAALHDYLWRAPT
jgi:hypothetical protein